MWKVLSQLLLNLFFVLFGFEGSVLALWLRMTKETFTTGGTWTTILWIY